MTEKQQKMYRLMKTASALSLGTVVFLVVLKLWAYFETGAVSILSGVLDSGQDFMTSLISFIAIRQAIEPADKKHRFGHGKAQAIGGMLQAGIIFISSLFLLSESVMRLWHPKPVQELYYVIVVSLISIFLTLFLVRFQSYVVRVTNALSIRIDQAHYTGDIFMNLGIICSACCVAYWDVVFVDSLFGIGVAIYLLITVYRIIKEALGMLMDAEMPEKFRTKIKEKVHLYPEVCELTDLKTRLSGSCVFIQFCVRMDPNLTLQRAHEITEFIEDSIKDDYPDTQIIIHIEPYIKRRG